MLVDFVVSLLNDPDAAEIAFNECGNETQVKISPRSPLTNIQEYQAVVQHRRVCDRKTHGWYHALVQLEHGQLDHGRGGEQS